MSRSTYPLKLPRPASTATEAVSTENPLFGRRR
jgi:hypothetical protein